MPTFPDNYVYAKNTFTPVGGSSLNIQETYQYLDGLGRPMQTVGKQQSPASKDVVTAVEYDKWGRQIKSYNPFEAATTSGAFTPTIPSGTPFGLSQYESSPLSRATSVTPPSWYATTTAYGTNIANEVKLDHAANTYYAAGSLLKTTITEPGTGGAGTGNKIITYKDKKGRAILVKRADNAGSQVAETYSQYDDKDRLKLVIPPGAAYNSTGLTFSYTYDGADNMLTKKVPDAAVVTMKYNTRDQLALEQDGNLLAQSKWRSIRYDDYGRPFKTGLFSGTIPNPILPTLDPTDLYTENTYDGTLAIEKGKLKKARVRVFDAGNTWLETNYTYDIYGRVSGSTGNNYLVPADLNAEAMGYVYDFADHVLIDTRVSKQSTTVSHTVVQTHTFDAWGRLKSNTHQLDNGATTTISDLNYDWKNQLIEKNLGKTATNSYLQSLDYTYNDQGWLQTINNATLGGANVTLASCTAPNPGAASSTPDNNDLFYLGLKYDVLQSGLSGTAQKNGNISQLVWRIRGRERQSYSLTYDYLDRLQNSTYADITDAGTPNTSNAYRENLTYDARGNILTLDRYGRTPFGACFTVSQIDNLSYAYNASTNTLKKISDSAPITTKQYGWHNTTGAPASAQFSYDANGNMTSDPYKGMSVSYNFLNLPSQMSFSSGTKTIDVLYTASGQKLRKTVTDNGTLQYRQDYVSGIEYRYTTAGGLTLEAVYHAEGRVYNNSGTLRYEYSIRDHLGNTRLTFTDKNANGVVDVTNTSANEILQENHFYPFGLDMAGPWMNDAVLDNQYKYNGKELNGDFGLNWMDYGARWYDASVGRWWSVDLMSSKTKSWSVYSFSFNNGVRFIDLFGLTPVYDWDAHNRGQKGIYRDESGQTVEWEEVQQGIEKDNFFFTTTMVNESSMTTEQITNSLLFAQDIYYRNNISIAFRLNLISRADAINRQSINKSDKELFLGINEVSGPPGVTTHNLFGDISTTLTNTYISTFVS
ncbi:MAG: hypothetical protein IPJ82_22700 [Lewinellaceae bacterium]|nr:hypothetical protein [Lewinellaceae bacterium]